MQNNDYIKPSEIGDKLIQQMQTKKTLKEIKEIWNNFLEYEDKNIVEAVKNYFYNYKDYYFYKDANGIVNIIPERVRGDF